MQNLDSMAEEIKPERFLKSFVSQKKERFILLR